MEIYDRIKLLCKQRGVTMTKLMEDLEIHISTSKGWKAGQIPSADRILKIAQYFNVSTDYILGNSEFMQTAQDALNDDDIISLQRARSKMSQRDRERMMDMLRIGFDYAFERKEPK